MQAVDPSVLPACSPRTGSPCCCLTIWDLSPSSYSPGPTSSHCLGNLHPPIPTCISRTRDPYCSHPRAANTKRDNCPFFQAWRTWEAALAAKPAFPKALHDATVLQPQLRVTSWTEIPHSSLQRRGASALDADTQRDAVPRNVLLFSHLSCLASNIFCSL